MAQTAGCCRLVWNKALALQKELLEQGGSCLSYYKLAPLLVEWKKEDGLFFLNKVHSQPLQQTLMDLDRAVKDAFSKESAKKFPRFKKKGTSTDSFRYPQGFKFDGNKVFLPKIGWVKFFKSREIIGTPKNITVSKRGGKWFFSVQVEQEITTPVHPSGSAIGIDVGIARFATFSDGDFIKPRNSFKSLEQKLAREQRSLARKIRRSNNWKKQKAKINRLHRKISDARNDFLQKESTKISKNHALIVLENLKVGNMSASAKGTIEEPGKSVAAKSGLNKSILDQGWYAFRRMLEYKQEWNGGLTVLINPKNTSRKCPVCDTIDKENRKTQSEFKCVKCGHAGNADHIAAQNILAAGHAVLACGDTIKRVAA